MTLSELIAHLQALRNGGASGDLPCIQGDDDLGWCPLFPEDVGVIDSPIAPGQPVLAIGDLLYRRT